MYLGRESRRWMWMLDTHIDNLRQLDPTEKGLRVGGVRNEGSDFHATDDAQQ